MSGHAVDPFGGPGGWAEGLRLLGLAEVGIELDPWACATRRAAGHQVIRADVARMPLGHLAGRVEGLIASPPCPLFSLAGSGAGRALLAELSSAIVDALAGRPTLAAHRRAMAHKLRRCSLAATRSTRADASARAWADATQASLTVQPARWIAATRPRWVALEQVPAVAPLWQVYARELRRLGYSTWTGVLNAADYGVPQTRRRAILMASLDRVVAPPAPTHAEGGASTLFGELAPWVSMADALGWTGEVHHWRGAGMAERHGPRPGRSTDDPAPTIEGGAHHRLLVHRDPNTPAPTLCGHRQPRWLYPDPEGTHADLWTLNRRQQHDGVPVRNTSPPTNPHPPSPASPAPNPNWVWERPATTVAGDPRITARCHHDDGTQGANAKTTDQVRAGDYDGTEPVRLTLTEALILQGFPPDYPVQGTKTAQFRQVGDAVPPPLAAAVVAALTGQALEAGRG